MRGALLRSSMVFLLVVGLVVGGGWPAGARTRVDRGEREAEVRLLRIINAHRHRAAKRALAEHRILRREARRHSEYMSREKKLSHDGFAGRVFRIMRDDDSIRFPRICEVVARAQAFHLDAETAARRAFRGMRDTSSGRRCLLDRDFTSQVAGIGVERRGRDWWFTAILAHRSR